MQKLKNCAVSKYIVKKDICSNVKFFKMSN